MLDIWQKADKALTTLLSSQVVTNFPLFHGHTEASDGAKKLTSVTEQGSGRTETNPSLSSPLQHLIFPCSPPEYSDSGEVGLFISARLPTGSPSPHCQLMSPLWLTSSVQFFRFSTRITLHVTQDAVKTHAL